MKTRSLFLSLFLATIAVPALAETGDRERPIEIYAHHFQGDEIHQVATYTGAVEVHQGTLDIRGDKLHVVVDRAGYRTVTITGKPVLMKEKRDTKTPGIQEWVHASALQAVYNEKTSKITFTRNAKLARSENGLVKDSTSGAVITYDLLTARSHVDGGVINGTRNRVSTILAPRSKAKLATPDSVSKKPTQPTPSATMETSTFLQ